MSQLDAVVTRLSHAPSAEPRRLIAEFPDDSNGVEALTEALRTVTRNWSISWAGEPAARLAHTQAALLLTYTHPNSTHLYLSVQYDEARQRLTITVGDPGCMLPMLVLGDQWRTALDTALEVEAFDNGGRDRRLLCVMRIRAPWRVRLTWDRTKMQGVHPEHTFDNRYSEQDARDSVVGALRHQTVRAIHWQGPEDRDDCWHEYSGDDNAIAEQDCRAHPSYVRR